MNWLDAWKEVADTIILVLVEKAEMSLRRGLEVSR
jgi:hypothetical protein